MIRRIVVSLALLILLLVMIGWLWRAAATYKPGVTVPCINNPEDRERLKRLSIRALDDAYEAQLEHLYEVWMKDSRDQPRRAQAGTSNAVAAWLAARQAVSKFEPSECAGGISK